MKPRAAPERLEEAVLLITNGSNSRAKAFREHARRSDPSLDLIFVSEDTAGRVIAAAAMVRHPGRLGNLHANAEAPYAAHMPALIDACVEGSRGAGISLAQSLADTTGGLALAALNSSCMQNLAVLAGMERSNPAPGSLAPVAWPVNSTLSTCVSVGRPMLEQLIVGTFEGTRDCPQLVGLRQPADILDGYQSVGQYDPKLWTILYLDGVAAGLSLVSNNPAAEVVELIYLGLLPFARGRGLGKLLLNQALRESSTTGSNSIVLACDEVNPPALHMYETGGFRRVFRKAAFIYSFDFPSSTSQSHHDA